MVDVWGETSRLSVAEATRLVARRGVPVPHRAGPRDIELAARWGRALLADRRVGVRRLGERLVRDAEACRAERRRVAALLASEAAYCPPDAAVIAGVDEAGRGPLAGPVVAAAVVLRPGMVIPGLDDSKRLAEDVREEVYATVIDSSLAVGVGIAGTGLVDRLNVLRATHAAMCRAVARLDLRPDYVLVDGFRVPGLDLPHRGVIQGDALCGSIAAASIVAKVTRDRIMRRVAERFPLYGFERNKGYATAGHLAVLREYGPCPAHRLSFLGRGRGSRRAGPDVGPDGRTASG